MTPSWLKQYLTLSEGTEIPDIFALWCGLSTLSAALGRNVWIDMSIFNIYPNMYIVLIASSGRCRKSIAISQLESLTSKMDPGLNLIAQKLTPEALIEAMRDKKEGYHQSFAVIDELVNFLNKRAYEQGLGGLLIALYDCKESFEYRTKSRGKEKLKNTCLGLLGGATMDSMREVIPLDAIGGGLTSRMLFVYVKNPMPPVPRPRKKEEHEAIKRELILRLDQIALLKGEFSLTKEAWAFYDNDYINFYNSSPLYENKHLKGYASRRHTHMLKLSMLFSIAETNKMIVELSHIEQALALLIDTETHLVEIFDQITSTETGSRVDLIRSFIHKRGDCSLEDLQRAFSRQLTARELGELTQTLIAGGEIEFYSNGRKVFYRWVR